MYSWSITDTGPHKMSLQDAFAVKSDGIGHCRKVCTRVYIGYIGYIQSIVGISCICAAAARRAIQHNVPEEKTFRDRVSVSIQTMPPPSCATYNLLP